MSFRRAYNVSDSLVATKKEDGMAQPQALPSETGHWWALALRGAIAILFGLAALLRPGIALDALILLFGAYALVDVEGRRAGCCSSRG